MNNEAQIFKKMDQLIHKIIMTTNNEIQTQQKNKKKQPKKDLKYVLVANIGCKIQKDVRCADV